MSLFNSVKRLEDLADEIEQDLFVQVPGQFRTVTIHHGPTTLERLAAWHTKGRSFIIRGGNWQDSGPQLSVELFVGGRRVVEVEGASAETEADLGDVIDEALRKVECKP